MKQIWDTLDKETFARVLAFLIIVAWLYAVIFAKMTPDQTLTAVVTLIVGYFFGSSTGSKRKDEALLPPAEGKPHA